MSRLVLGLVQMNVKADKVANIARACELVDEAAARGANFVGLPEMFNYLGPGIREQAEAFPGETHRALAAKARQHGLWMHCGSIPEVAEDGRYYNTTVVLNPEGEPVAKYRKVHLFDIHVPGQAPHKESSAVAPGQGAVVFDTPWGRMGLTICYDLRFPELYRSEALAGAKLIWAPAAFTLYTGKDHWEVLIRARAIENEVFMACPAVIGARSDGTKPCFGASMLVDPWGTVVAKAPERDAVVVGEVDFDYQQQVRTSIPVFDHRVPEAYRVHESVTGDD